MMYLLREGHPSVQVIRVRPDTLVVYDEGDRQIVQAPPEILTNWMVHYSEANADEAFETLDLLRELGPSTEDVTGASVGVYDIPLGAPRRRTPMVRTELPQDLDLGDEDEPLENKRLREISWSEARRGDRVHLQFLDGDRTYAEVLQVDSDSMMCRTELGRETLLRDQISEILLLDHVSGN